MTEINHDLIIYRLEEIDRKFEITQELLKEIKEQTAKTNGRVNQLEIYQKNCKNNTNKTSNAGVFNLGNQKIILLLIIVILTLLGVNIFDLFKIM